MGPWNQVSWFLKWWCMMNNHFNMFLEEFWKSIWFNSMILLFRTHNIFFPVWHKFVYVGKLRTKHDHVEISISVLHLARPKSLRPSISMLTSAHHCALEHGCANAYLWGFQFEQWSIVVLNFQKFCSVSAIHCFFAS